MEKLSKKTKVMITSVGVIAVLAVGGGVYASNQSKQKMIEAQATVTTKTNDLIDLKKDINKLLDPVDNDFLKKDIKESQVKEVRRKLDTILKEKHDERLYLSDYNKESKNVQKAMESVETKFKTQTAINQLFKQEKENVALNGSTVKKDLSIVDDLKKETVESTKKEYYKKDSKTDYDKANNELIVNAENQVKQIETAKQAVSKVFKDDKVISTDNKLYDTAKTETDKIKNAKAKKPLSDQLSKVKKDIDKKAEETKKQEEQKANAEGASTTEKNNQESKVVSEVDQGNADQAQTAINQETGTTPDYSGGGVDAGNTGQGGQTLPPETNYPQNPTPPTNNGGNNTVTPEPTEPQTPTEPTTPTGPPAGWITPPFPIGSAELGGWIFDNGYSGYDISDGYIRPY